MCVHIVRLCWRVVDSPYEELLENCSERQLLLSIALLDPNRQKKIWKASKLTKIWTISFNQMSVNKPILKSKQPWKPRSTRRGVGAVTCTFWYFKGFRKSYVTKHIVVLVSLTEKIVTGSLLFFLIFTVMSNALQELSLIFTHTLSFLCCCGNRKQVKKSTREEICTESLWTKKKFFPVSLKVFLWGIFFLFQKIVLLLPVRQR